MLLKLKKIKLLQNLKPKLLQNKTKIVHFLNCKTKKIDNNYSKTSLVTKLKNLKCEEQKKITF